MGKPVEIGTYSRNGLYQLINKDRDINSAIILTVRETSGEQTLSKARIESMKKFAVRALPDHYEGKAAKVALVRTGTSSGYASATFAVSLLEG
jgi:hypothetical protein